MKTKDHTPDTSYRVLHDYLAQEGKSSPSVLDVYHAVIEVRNSKLPDPARLANAGSFFKHPIIEESLLETIRKDYPDIPLYRADEGRRKGPPGWLIEKTGRSGKRWQNTGT